MYAVQHMREKRRRTRFYFYAVGIPTADRSQMMMTQNHKSRGSSLTFGHRSHPQQVTAPQAVSADHRTACMVEATATLHARSDASCGCGSLVWIHCDASHTDRVKSRAFIMRCCSCHTRQDGREGAAWQCWQAERGGQRSAMLVRVADRVLVLT